MGVLYLLVPDFLSVCDDFCSMAHQWDINALKMLLGKLICYL